jgi:hypothetical protein
MFRVWFAPGSGSWRDDTEERNVWSLPMVPSLNDATMPSKSSCTPPVPTADAPPPKPPSWIGGSSYLSISRHRRNRLSMLPAAGQLPRPDPSHLVAVPPLLLLLLLQPFLSRSSPSTAGAGGCTSSKGGSSPGSHASLLSGGERGLRSGTQARNPGLYRLEEAHTHTASVSNSPESVSVSARQVESK